MTMTELLVAVFSLSVLVHLLLAAAYVAFGIGANRWLAAWLCLAWAIAILRVLALLTLRGPTDWLAVAVWINVLGAAIACLISCWARAKRAGFTRP